MRFVEVDGGGSGARCSKVVQCSFVRARAASACRRTQARPRRSLRNLLQEASIPAWERSYLPYLWCGDRLSLGRRAWASM